MGQLLPLLRSQLPQRLAPLGLRQRRVARRRGPLVHRHVEARTAQGEDVHLRRFHASGVLVLKRPGLPAGGGGRDRRVDRANKRRVRQVLVAGDPVLGGQRFIVEPRISSRVLVLQGPGLPAGGGGRDRRVDRANKRRVRQVLIAGDSISGGQGLIVEPRIASGVLVLKGRRFVAGGGRVDGRLVLGGVEGRLLARVRLEIGLESLVGRGYGGLVLEGPGLAACGRLGALDGLADGPLVLEGPGLAAGGGGGDSGVIRCDPLRHLLEVGLRRGPRPARALGLVAVLDGQRQVGLLGLRRHLLEVLLRRKLRPPAPGVGVEAVFGGQGQVGGFGLRAYPGQVLLRGLGIPPAPGVGVPAVLDRQGAVGRLDLRSAGRVGSLDLLALGDQVMLRGHPARVLRVEALQDGRLHVGRVDLLTPGHQGVVALLVGHAPMHRAQVLLGQVVVRLLVGRVTPAGSACAGAWA